jgi:hypothetical protein
MSDLAVITPSFGPDAGIFQDLRRSVQEHTPSSTIHSAPWIMRARADSRRISTQRRWR